MKNNVIKNYLVGISIAVLTIVVAMVLGILQELEVIDTGIKTFLLLFIVLTLGFSIALLVNTILHNDIYTYLVGSILFAVGILLLFIGLEINTSIIVISVIGIILILFLVLVLINIKKVHIETTDEKEDYVPYEEKLDKEKQEQQKEKEEIPQIKSFK